MRLSLVWFILIALACAPALAHRDGCHMRHSCEPDTRGAYICGDKGLCQECADNAFCERGKPRPGDLPIPRDPAAEEAEEPARDEQPSLSEPQLAGEFKAKVRSVSDGDTLVVEDRDRQRNWIRIAGIDAPESGSKVLPGQSYSGRSRRHLAKLVAGKEVRIEWSTYDSFKRIVARVWVDGTDAGLAQICAGYAWVYEEYLGDLSPEEQQAYRACQEEARLEKRGLWRDPRPTPPWEWRRSQMGEEAR